MSGAQESTNDKRFSFQKIFILASVLVLVFWGIFLFSLDTHLVNASKSILLEKSEIRDEMLNTREITEISFDITKNLEQPNIDINSGLELFEKKVETGQSTRNDSEPNLKLLEYKNQKMEAKKEKNELESKLLRFEKEEFLLKGIGNAWEAAPHTGKQAQINLKLHPVKGKALTEFEITHGKIIIGDASFNFEKGTVEIRDSEIFVTILAKGSGFPFGIMTGTFYPPNIDSHYKTHAKFENQLFYLNSADRSPFHLTFDVILQDQ